MKKQLILGLVAIASWFATSCQNELDQVNSGKTSTVSIKVETPEIKSRAYSDGMTVTKLQYAVYADNGTLLTNLSGGKDITGSTNVNLQLTTGDKYNVIFWAAAKDAPYIVDFADNLESAKMTVSYEGAESNDENRDAFYCVLPIEVTGSETVTAELKRPFAQLNIGTNDYDLSKSAGYVPTQSAVTVKNVYSTLNFNSGEVSGETEAVFASADIKKDETFPVKGYQYVAMNYLLVNEETVDVEFTLTDANGKEKTRKVGSVPVERNHRTNIYGKLLTSSLDINVDILPDYDEPAHNIVETFVNQLAKGGLVTLLGDIVLTDYPEGLVITNNTEINLDGHTLTLPDVDASSRKALITVDDTNNPVNLTIMNGKLVVASTNEITNGKGASTGGSQVVKFSSYGKLTLDNVEITGSQRGGHRAIEATYGNVELNNCKIGVNYGTAVNSNNAKVVINNCDITINGMYKQPYNSVCFSVMYGGEVTINGGNYKLINNATYSTGNTHGGWVGIAMSSGGTINLNDGTFENVPADGFIPANERAIIQAENNNPAVSTVVFAGGKYKPQAKKIYDGYGDQYHPKWVNADKLTLGADGWYTIADNKGYVEVDGEYRVSTGAGLAAAVTDAPDNAKITLTANVDLTGVDYTPRSFKSLVFNGQNYTISGVKVENATQAALFGKTWKFDIQNVTLANSSFTGQNIDGEDSAGGFIAFLQTYSDGSQIVNCHVKNCTIGSAKYVGGIVAYKDGNYPIKIENCSVKNSKLVSNYTEDGTKYKGHIGGLVGYLCGEANSTVNNCVVENNTFEVLGARGGLFIGSAQADYNVSGKVEGNTGLAQLCGEVNKITNWNNVAVSFLATNQAEFDAAFTKNAVIKLGEGNYTINKFPAGAIIIGKGENTVIDASRIITPEGDVTIENVKLIHSNDGYKGFQHANIVTIKKSVVLGQPFLYAKSFVCEDCTFEQESKSNYNVWTYSAEEVSFTNCEFNCDGRSVLIYQDGPSLNQNVTFEGCTFNATTPANDGKAAIEIGTNNLTTGFYTVVINNCTAKGFDNGSVSGSILWNVKNGNRAKVTVDGTVVFGV